MKISIAMCTYNGQRYLQQMLDSISTQVLLPFELVVCDDSSDDNTVALLETFRGHAPFPVRIFRNAVNLGYSRNFVRAIELCGGEVIALADQDDIWYPRKLQQLANVFARDPAIEGAFSDGEVLDEMSRPVGRALWQSFLFGSSEQTRFRRAAVDVLIRRNVVTGMALAFRSSAKDLLPPMPASWIHDGWLAIQLAIRSRIVALPDHLVGYRVHASQQIGTPLSLSGKIRKLLSNGIADYLRQMRIRNLDEYQRTARQFDDLSTWLQTCSVDAPLKAKVSAKAAYAHRGAMALSRNRLSRIPLLAPNMMDYAKFSPNGLRGLLRDLVV